MIRLAFIGTSKIASQFADAAVQSGHYCFEAIYSRKKETAQKFCEQFPFKKIYTSLEALAEDKDVDAVYIASPNSLHFKQSMLMMSHQKHVICEKPMAVSLDDCIKMLQAAAENKVVFLEAMRPAFDPGFKAISENLKKLGIIRRVSFSFCQYSSRYDNFRKGIIANVFNPEMGGGSLLDIGIYPVYMLALLFGLPKRCFNLSVRLDNGIDGLGELIAQYDGFIGEISYSKITNSFVPSRIEGENGYMTIDKISEPTQVIIRYNSGQTEVVYQSELINNMLYEADAFAQFIESKTGLTADGKDISVYHKASQTATRIIDMAVHS